ncbi:hypothetical protein OS493_026328 [Desmophyllum pertusum]|uniref:Uncharacterized protein n=1 Tax=Desmophyllum pertusum TaxID=174260 RepID=A0A9W9ZMS9_9CNID|nr:hypothetical protein OS493_026328 [Desmophyllum pertusum]
MYRSEIDTIANSVMEAAASTTQRQKSKVKVHRVKSCPQPFDLIFQIACSKDSLDSEFTEAKKMIDFLRKKGREFELDAISASGMTALTQCALDGNLKSVKALIELGANVNKKDGQGLTALHYAASEGYINIVKYLLRCNADVRALSREDQMPMDVADGEDVRKLLSRVTLFYSPIHKKLTRQASLPAWL